MPYGNMSNSKTFNYNKRFSFSSGLPLDQYINDLQFAFSIENQLLSSYNGYLIEVEEDGGSTTQEFGILNGTIDRTAIENFCGVNNGYVIGIYDQKSGIKTVISTLAQQIEIVSSGVFQVFTAKYLLEIPQYTLLTVSGIAACNRMKNMSMVDYIAFKGEKVDSGYTGDYVFPIKCSAGLMDFKISNGTNVFWYDADGGISTADRPSLTLTNAGINYMFATNMSSQVDHIQISANGTSVRYVGDLKDFPRLYYYLNLYDCYMMTGDLSSLGARLRNYLSLNDCPLITGDLSSLGTVNTSYLNLGIIGRGSSSLITGDLADLGGNITLTLFLTNCNLISGDLADLGGKVSNYLRFDGCPLIYGVYTPSNSSNTPITFYTSNSGMTANDVDNTLIACHSKPKSNVAFTWVGLSRTAASDTAATELDTTYSWTFNPVL